MSGMQDIETTVREDNRLPRVPAPQPGSGCFIQNLSYAAHRFFVLQ
jgi:hypothetical protein